MIDYIEISTPLTLENFTGKQRGSMYGLPVNKARYDLTWLNAKTSINNLYLTGSDVMILGVSGATLGGIICASKIGDKMGILSLYIKMKKDIIRRRRKEARRLNELQRLQKPS